MGEVARAQTSQSQLRDLLRRVADLERGAGHAVDVVARQEASTKNGVYRQDEEPTGGTYVIGDLWFDTNDGYKLYRWDGAGWESVQDTAIEAAKEAANAAKTTADGKNQIYRLDSEPTGGTYANGDLWFDTDAGNKPYIYQDGVWLDAQDNLAVNAKNTAVAAQTTADGKNKIFIQSTPVPVATKAGDQWIDTTSGHNIIKGWNGTAWGPLPLGAPAIGAVSATVITGQLVAAQIAAGTITANEMKAGTITAASGIIGSLDAGKITTGTLDASRITVTNLSATAITTGTISSSVIATSSLAAVTIDAGKITTGTLDASKITVANLSASAITTGTLTALNYYSSSSGNRIALGPAANIYNNSEPRIIFDYDGTIAAADPSIRAASTGLIIHGGDNGNQYTSIEMSAGLGQRDQIIMKARDASNSTVSALLDASQNRFYCSGSITSGGNVAPGNGNVLMMGATLYGSAVGSAPNVWVGDSGASYPYGLRRTSFVAQPASSARFKTEIEDLSADALDPARLLTLPIRQFRYVDEHEPWPDHPGRLYPGFIAEEIEEVYPAATHYDPDDGTPLNYYERALVPGMLALIQQQHARITALENR